MTFEQKIGAAFAEASEFALVNLVWYGLAAGVASLTLYVILRKASLTAVAPSLTCRRSNNRGGRSTIRW